MAEAAASSGSLNFRIRLVRHGETDANVRRICEADTPTPLNCTGRRQAAALGAVWRAEGATFSRVYSSDIARALETCRTVLQIEDAAIVREPLLQERQIGDLKGMDYDEANRLRAEAERNGRRIPGLETSEQMVVRVAEFFDKVCEDMTGVGQHGAEVAVFSHGGLLYTFLVYLQKTCDLQLEHLMPFKKLHASPNTGQTRLTVLRADSSAPLQVTCQMLYSDQHLTDDLRPDYFLAADGTKITREQ